MTLNAQAPKFRTDGIQLVVGELYIPIGIDHTGRAWFKSRPVNEMLCTLNSTGLRCAQRHGWYAQSQEFTCLTTRGSLYAQRCYPLTLLPEYLNKINARPGLSLVLETARAAASEAIKPYTPVAIAKQRVTIGDYDVFATRVEIDGVKFVVEADLPTVIRSALGSRLRTIWLKHKGQHMVLAGCQIINTVAGIRGTATEFFAVP
jgi:hypothetical protein